MKVLAVDDTKNDRLLLTKIISSAGESACNGVEALEKIKIEKPGLIISDILIPEMDGFRLCRELKTKEGTKGIPILFYTATYTESEDEKLAMLEGAAGFIRKPEEPLRIIEVINKTMEKYGAGKYGHFDTECHV
jgi:CheY-like chemotaxis protein